MSRFSKGLKRMIRGGKGEADDEEPLNAAPGPASAPHVPHAARQTAAPGPPLPSPRRRMLTGLKSKLAFGKDRSSGVADSVPSSSFDYEAGMGSLTVCPLTTVVSAFPAGVNCSF